jgi:hypothetical protein
MAIYNQNNYKTLRNYNIYPKAIHKYEQELILIAAGVYQAKLDESLAAATQGKKPKPVSRDECVGLLTISLLGHQTYACVLDKANQLYKIQHNSAECKEIRDAISRFIIDNHFDHIRQIKV